MFKKNGKIIFLKHIIKFKMNIIAVNNLHSFKINYYAFYFALLPWFLIFYFLFLTYLKPYFEKLKTYNLFIFLSTVIHAKTVELGWLRFSFFRHSSFWDIFESGWIYNKQSSDLFVHLRKPDIKNRLQYFDRSDHLEKMSIKTISGL